MRIKTLMQHLHAPGYIRDGAITLVLRCIGIAGEFVIAVLLARQLDAEGYGIYVYAYALMRVLAIPAQAGLPTLVVREVSAYESTGKWGLLRGLLRRVNQAVFAISVIIAALTLLYATFLSDWGAEKMTTFMWALVLLPLVALGNVRGAALRGLHRLTEGQLPESLIRPAMFVTLLVATRILWLDVSPSEAMAMHVIAASIAFAIGAALLLKRLPSQVASHPPVYLTSRWVRSAFPLSVLTGMIVANNQIGLLMLGNFAADDQVGIYGAMAQFALVTTVPQTAINMSIAPRLSKLNATAQFEELAAVSRKMGVLSAIMTLVSTAVLVTVGNPLIERAIGQEFTPGYPALVLISVGYSLFGLSGVSMILLNMTGRERLVARAFVAALAINLVGCALSIPEYGLFGAAASMALAQGTLGGMLAWYSRKAFRT